MSLPAVDFTVSLPEWAVEETKKIPRVVESLDERMAIVNRFADLNYKNNTGGPFAAAVFERDTGKLVVVGVNRVVPSNCSSAHAEVTTLSLAQRSLSTFDLGGADIPIHQLVVNWRPCCMCYGAVVWSGIRSLVIAGSGPELEQITGFDEGPIHPEWKKELEKRGIEVLEGVGREEAIKVFEGFRDSGNLVYNGRLGG